MRKILRTIFYAPSEIPFIKMNLWESREYIDLFVICEFNRTHVGTPREFIFDHYRDHIPQELQSKIHYLPADISHGVKLAEEDDGAQMHENETLMRDYFSSLIDLQDEDIIISLDADEVLYRHMYWKIYDMIVSGGAKALLLPLHQFIYRMNYLWEDNIFWAPTVCRKSFYNHSPKPHNWRYDGQRFPFFAGCHFSWQLSIDEMLTKLHSYAHRDKYPHLMNREALLAAVVNKAYPFDPDRPFFVKELDIEVSRSYYPRSFYRYLKDFRHLLPDRDVWP